MINLIAEFIAKSVQKYLSNDKEENAKDDVAQGPPILQGPHNQNDLAGDIDKQEKSVDNVEDDKECHGLGGTQSDPTLECADRDAAGHDEHQYC